MEVNRIICGNHLEIMKGIPDNYIDLTVTSPPYDNLRTYKGFIFDFEPLAKELYRVTKQGGVVVWVVGDATIKGSETLTSCKQKIYFRENCGFNIHDTMIYQKLCYMPLTHNRYENVFEYMFIFSKGKPNTFNPKTKPNKEAGKKITGRHRHDGNNLKIIHGEGKLIKEKGIDINIWQYKTGWNHSYSDKKVTGHPAIFPEKLAQDHILSWSNKDDIVLDPI